MDNGTLLYLDVPDQSAVNTAVGCLARIAVRSVRAESAAARHGKGVISSQRFATTDKLCFLAINWSNLGMCTGRHVDRRAASSVGELAQHMRCGQVSALHADACSHARSVGSCHECFVLTSEHEPIRF